jgi:2-C-methyl-D-erythritol 4-phosphate cytidylyltransferase
VAVVGLLVAAGTGERLGGVVPKAFVECAGRPLLEWSLDVLRASCDRVVVAVPPGYERDARGGVAPAAAPDGADRVAGAASRSGSVRAALAAAPEADVAVVHDAARPLVTAELVERCVGALDGGWDGAVAAARATDTLKEAQSEDGRVVRTLARERVWAVQTPQAFRPEALRRALDVDDAALAAASDDAALLEAAGGAVRVVEAPAENLKVTTGLDLRMAEALLRERAAAAARGREANLGGAASAPPGRDGSEC